MLKQIGDYQYLIDDHVIANNNEWGYCELTGQITNMSNGQYRLKLIGCDNPAILGKRFTMSDFATVVRERWKQADGRPLTEKCLKKVRSLYSKRASISDTISALMMMY